MKGFITFYINFTDMSQKQEETFLFIKNSNKELFAKLNQAGYEIMFVPTFGEASRMEKVDLDMPHPRQHAFQGREE